MTETTPIERRNVLLEGDAPLTSVEKDMFAYFGVNAKIRPPYRILNPQNIVVGDMTSIREGCHINAFTDLSFLMEYIDPRYRGEFDPENYQYESRIEFGRECQIGRFVFMSCTSSIFIGNNVLFSERVFVGDNNHGYDRPHVPIMQQANSKGTPVSIGAGSWVGVGAAIMRGVEIGENCVVGANSVCRGGNYPSHSVIGPPSAVVLTRG